MSNEQQSPVDGLDNEVWASMNIHQRMVGILGDLPAIGKNQRNQAQGFNFRGIDDVLNALNPLLAKWGVYFTPTVVERISETRQTKKGDPLNVVHLLVRYTFTGFDGSAISASGWGEGTDSGDKATNKAMTSAMKYVLFQAFAISTEEASNNDSDSVDTEAATDPKAEARAEFYKLFDTDEPGYTEGWTSFDEFDAAHNTFVVGMKSLDKPAAEKVKAWRAEQGYGWPMNRAAYEATVEYVGALDKADDFGAAEETGATE